MTPGQLADAYLAALQASDEAGVLALFAGDAIVHSPLYGPVPAAEFYPALFRDTTRASLTLHGVTSGTSPAGAPLVGLWFHSPGASATAGMLRLTSSTCSNWALTA
jgi:hypothetical protein